jgi:hypothetical protein
VLSPNIKRRSGLFVTLGFSPSSSCSHSQIAFHSLYNRTCSVQASPCAVPLLLGYGKSFRMFDKEFLVPNVQEQTCAVQLPFEYQTLSCKSRSQRLGPSDQDRSYVGRKHVRLQRPESRSGTRSCASYEATVKACWPRGRVWRTTKVKHCIQTRLRLLLPMAS